jgi:hypothetical protein
MARNGNGGELAQSFFSGMMLGVILSFGMSFVNTSTAMLSGGAGIIDRAMDSAGISSGGQV